ncbi:SDR family oxidoreductase [Cupriavidus basilensis]|uniref:SDR family oxidoreductase n=1 Tax=Cupriavidus basilensis TaxID=68895 RepID=UPI0028521368|nr:SDR family oxidoreductase [Cupriavidus basilensis]MDR3382785.1 SDR family oxidoreductase [Cupriavidus basilensis]
MHAQTTQNHPTRPLSGRTAVIIGGTSGIGRAVASRVVAAGGAVILGGRSQDALDAELARIEAAGGAACGHVVDMAERESVAAFFARIARLDYLFAPGATYQVASIHSDDHEAVESPFRSKFWGQYHAVHEAAPKIAPDGAIVLMSGAAGARPIKGASAYAACNAAIEGLGRSLALELAPVRVNSVSPGTIDSDLWQRRSAELRSHAFESYSRSTALGRVGSVDEVADAVLFLFGNGYMTGSTLFVDGGYVLP